MAEEGDEIFSNFHPMWAFGLEMSEGENQKESKSKPTNESNSVKEDGSNKKRQFAVVESKDLDTGCFTQELRTLEKQGKTYQKLVPISLFANFFPLQTFYVHSVNA